MGSWEPPVKQQGELDVSASMDRVVYLIQATVWRRELAA